MTLALIGRQLGPLESVVAVAQAAGVAARACPADLAREEQIHDLSAALKRVYNYVDIRVHSAAMIRMGTVRAPSPMHRPRTSACTRRRTSAARTLTQDLLPLMRLRQGRIVFINSSAVLTARANVGEYAATKHALKAIADSLRDEVNRDGVRVLSVFPEPHCHSNARTPPRPREAPVSTEPPPAPGGPRRCRLQCGWPPPYR